VASQVKNPDLGEMRYRNRKQKEEKRMKVTYQMYRDELGSLKEGISGLLAESREATHLKVVVHDTVMEIEASQLRSEGWELFSDAMSLLFQRCGESRPADDLEITLEVVKNPTRTS